MNNDRITISRNGKKQQQKTTIQQQQQKRILEALFFSSPVYISLWSGFKMKWMIEKMEWKEKRVENS